MFSRAAGYWTPVHEGASFWQGKKLGPPVTGASPVPLRPLPGTAVWR